jgi:FkbM family methyltransferase
MASLSRLKHWTKLALAKEYRNNYIRKKEVQQELQRIKNLPRYTHTSTNKILDGELNIVDGRSFFHSYKEIFEREIYNFPTSKTTPVIIDGGSNIGLSIIYLKKLYPHSKILSFEADPHVFQTLQTNILSFGLNDVSLHNQALWNEETYLEFAVEGADGGRLATDIDENKQEKIKVTTVRLRDYLTQQIDFLKLDIEGAETDVIIDCAEYLLNVENLFIEYHSFANQEQRLDELLSILRKFGFRIQIKTQYAANKPFLNRSLQLGMDLQLNLFGYRDRQ